VRMLDVPEAVGQSFNLVGDPLLSARDYFDAIAERAGTRIRLASGSLTGFYLVDMAKYLLKRHALGQRDLAAPSLVDWRSRAHLSPFDNRRAKTVLGWRPAATRQEFIERAIDGRGLFGF
jgi:nucleoside-diphosphate-sugar epimerase